MAEIWSFPNNSAEYIGAEEVMRWLHGRTSGVYAGEGNAAVSAVQNAMQVQVARGIGWIVDANANGICWWFDAPITLDIQAAEATGTLGRIDRVIVEWETTDYAALPEVKVLTGTSSSSPVPPALTNSSTLRQLSLAQVSIPAGTTVLTDVLITDERFDPEVCGIVTESVTADTSMIAAQYAAAVQTLYDAIAQAWEGEISDGTITKAKLSPELQKTVMQCQTAFAIPSQGTTVAYDMFGMTEDHHLISWNFSESAENDPPCDLTCRTYNGYFTVTNDSGSTSETMQPIFAVPTAVAISAH